MSGIGTGIDWTIAISSSIDSLQNKRCFISILECGGAFMAAPSFPLILWRRAFKSERKITRELERTQ